MGSRELRGGSVGDGPVARVLNGGVRCRDFAGEDWRRMRRIASVVGRRRDIVM